MQMIRAKCRYCEWTFDVVSAPMPLTLWADTAKRRAACPMCGCDKAIMADPRPLTADEIACKKSLHGKRSDEVNSP